MTSKLYPLASKTIAALSIAILFNSSACTKKTNADDAKKFVATWKGMQNCGGGSAPNMTFTINQGSDGVTATTTFKTGIGSCQRDQTITGTAKDDVLTFPAQTISDACGLTYDIEGFASITNNTISISLTVVDNKGLSATCNFSGTPQ